jgi:thiamine-phosphate pyrophosphorylase
MTRDKLRTPNSELRAEVICGLYAIADAHWNPAPTLADLVRMFLDGGCRLVQLRMKSDPANPEEGLENRVRGVAREIMGLKEGYDFTFIVNDYPRVALEVGADGIHVGQGDMPVEELRSLVGRGMIVGYSSHDIEEAKRAVSAGADYVSFGAIFPTSTKGPGHPVQGLARLRELSQVVEVPVVAIGGIRRENVRQVIEAGAAAAAMITALSQAPDVVDETAWFVGAIGEVQR